MFEHHTDNLSEVVNVLADGGYAGENFAKAIKKLLDCSVEVVKRNEVHKFEVLQNRWIVDRTFSWLDKCRRLWKNCERKLHTSLMMVELALLTLFLKRL